MFSEELEKIDWEETTKAIYSKTESDVLRALGKEHCDVDDFMALISPAAAKYLEPMAQLSKKYTEERFGKTISMFIPLYITNSCTNSCVYCGFHISNPMARTILTPEQIEDEYKAIKKLGPFENLLLVTGENPAKAGVPYLAKALDIAKKYFSNLKIEVMPLKAEEYAELKEHGLNGVICFQETYNKARYNIYHPRGMKSKFEWRVNGFDRMGQAGVHSIGMGILVTFGSYMKEDVSIEESTENVEVFDTAIAIMAGLMIIPAVFAFSGGNPDTLQAGPALMFITIPKVFASMGFGTIAGILFFLLVLFAAVTSSIALTESAVSTFEDELGWSRERATALIGLIMVALGSLSALGYGPLAGVTMFGMQFLDFFDFLTNSVMMPIAAIAICLLVSRVIGVQKIEEEVTLGGKPFRRKKIFNFMIQYLCPIFAAIILISSVANALGWIAM